MGEKFVSLPDVKKNLLQIIRYSILAFYNDTSKWQRAVEIGDVS